MAENRAIAPRISSRFLDWQGVTEYLPFRLLLPSGSVAMTQRRVGVPGRERNRRQNARARARQIRIGLKGEPTRRGEREKRKGEHVEGTACRRGEGGGDGELRSPAGNQFSRNEGEISARRTSYIRRITMI